jgi:hypothetical protein
MKEMQESFLSFQSSLEKDFTTFTNQETSFQQSFSKSILEWKDSLHSSSNSFSLHYQQEQMKNQEILTKKAKDIETVSCFNGLSSSFCHCFLLLFSAVSLFYRPSLPYLLIF